MSIASGHVLLLGVHWEVEVEYTDFGDNEIEIEQAHLIGVYLKGDNLSRRDYTSMSCSVPLDPSELSASAYDRLLELAAKDIQEIRYERQAI